MLIARNKLGKKCCAKCGKEMNDFIKDRFLPTSCSHSVPTAINYIGVCSDCHKLRLKEKVIAPSWYNHLSKEQKDNLLRQMKYNRSYILMENPNESVMKELERIS